MVNPIPLPPFFPGLGEALSVGAALFWAGAMILFRVVGREVDPRAVNLFKNGLAAALLGITSILLGQPLVPNLPAADLAVFLLSGIVGIALADTLALIALNKLGAEIFAVVDCGYSPFVIGLSFVFLGERMDAVQFAGVGLIILAVVLIGGRRGGIGLPRSELLAGIAIGLACVFFMAAGIVMVKPMLGRTPLLGATFFRVIGGTAGMVMVVGASPRRRALVKPLWSWKRMRLLLPASFLATYLSTLCWLAGMSLTAASVAAALNQLSTIFIFLLAAVFLKEKATPLKIAAVLLAFAGALLVSVRV